MNKSAGEQQHVLKAAGANSQKGCEAVTGAVCCTEISQACHREASFLIHACLLTFWATGELQVLRTAGPPENVPGMPGRPAGCLLRCEDFLLSTVIVTLQTCLPTPPGSIILKESQEGSDVPEVCYLV